MITNAQLLNAYIPMDRRQALAHNHRLPEQDEGAVLFADISGFSRLTSALESSMGARRGAERLALHLNEVYERLIAEVDRYGGSVIGFSGDAITCWFSSTTWWLADNTAASPAPQRAVACALAQQSAVRQFGSMEVSGQGSFPLFVKMSVSSGIVRHFEVGDPDIQLMDVIVGAPLETMAAGERLAERGEILVDALTAAEISDGLLISEWRSDENLNLRFAVVGAYDHPVAPAPWPEMPAERLDAYKIKPWLLPAVLEHLDAGLGEFLTELRPAVALFVHFSGIDFDAASAAQQLDGYIRWVQRVLSRNLGTLIQLTIGEKGSYLYAAFGAPRAHENDPWYAANTALELCSLPPELDYIQDTRIGISLGVMRTGAYGSSNRRTYGVLGNEVNMAARLMQNAHRDGEILVSDVARKTLGAAFTFHEMEPIQVKGRSEPVQLAALEGKPMYIETIYDRLVGREAELQQLADFAAPVFADSPAFGGMVYVYGETGMGKSHLLYEFHQRLKGSDCRFQWFDCPTEYTIHQSLYPFRRFLYAYFQQRVENSPEENLYQFHRVLNNLLGKLDAIESIALRMQLERTRSMLAAMVDLYWDGSLYQQLEPKLRFENTLAAFKALILAESLLCPLVLHISDAHWLDPDSQRMLQILTQSVETFPFLIVLSGRCDDEGECFETAISGDVLQQGLFIDGLGPDDLRALVQSILERQVEGETQHSVHPKLLEYMHEKTAGNPLFVEQLCLDLHQRDLIHLQKNTWVLAQTGMEGVPASLHALLIANLDRQGTIFRVAVQTAAVLGLEFEISILQRMLPDMREWPYLIAHAQNTRTWVPSIEGRYMFRLPMQQDVIYEMQAQAHVQQLHARAVEAIEQIHQHDLAPYYASLAHHSNRAGMARQTLDYAYLAGQHAASQFANAQAVEYYHQALQNAVLLESGETLVKRQRVHAALGEVLFSTAQYPAARQQLGEALALAAEEENLDAQARSCRWIARVHENQGEFPQALEWVERGLTILLERQTSETCGLLDIAGLISSRQGNYEQAMDYALRSLRVAEHLGDASALARVFNLLGHINRLRGDSAGAVTYFHKALDLYQHSADLSGQALAHNQIANACFGLGDWHQAVHHFSLAREIFEQTGDAYNRSFTQNNLGWLALNQGRLDDALECYLKGLDTVEQIGGSAWLLGGFHNNLGATYIRRGELEAARQHLDISQSYFERAGARDWLSELYRHRASAALLAGDLPQAGEQAAQALALARELGMRAEEGSALRVSGEIALAQGQPEAAVEHLQHSIRILSEIGEIYELARSQLKLAGLYLSLGQPAAARSTLTQCIPVFERLEAAIDLDEAHTIQMQAEGTQ